MKTFLEWLVIILVLILLSPVIVVSLIVIIIGTVFYGTVLALFTGMFWLIAKFT